MRALLLHSAQILQIRAQAGDRQEKFSGSKLRSKPPTTEKDPTIPGQGGNET
jgi:hypothetical protein